MRLPPRKTQPPTRHFRLPPGQPPHFEAKRGSGGRARRISVCRKTQRVRDPRPTTHKSALKAVVFCPPAIARPYTSRPWSRRPARSRAISPATSLLISSYLNTISRDRWRVNRRTSRRSRPASRADVAALCRKPWGRTSRGKPAALPNRRTIRRTDSPESRTSGAERAAVEAMEERAGFVAAGLGPLDQGGGGLIGQGHALFLGPAFPPNPDRGGAAHRGPASTSARSRLHSSARRNPRSNKHARIALSLRARESVASSNRGAPEQPDVEQVRASHVAARLDPGSLDVETPIRPADLT